MTFEERDIENQMYWQRRAFESEQDLAASRKREERLRAACVLTKKFLDCFANNRRADQISDAIKTALEEK